MTHTELPIEFGADGLVPAVIVDASAGDVLMVGFMNREALDRTRETGQVHFWSRSRQTLWRKGETSGHTQTVREIRVNCEQNSLLIEVDQAGAVCHEGYATCYFRRLEPDNSLTVIRDRVFDPADVYRSPDQTPGLADLTQTHFAAYGFLASQPVIPASRTSALLHARDDEVTQRIADELDELAGVLDGSHVHNDPRSDATLEAGQVIYWLTLRAVRDEVTWDQVRPDRALDAAGSDHVATSMLARLLRSDAAGWRSGPNSGSPADIATGEPIDVAPDPVSSVLQEPDTGSGATHGTPIPGTAERTAAHIHASLTLVGQALGSFNIDPRDVIARDLAELRSKPYLAPFFAAAPARRQL